MRALFATVTLCALTATAAAQQDCDRDCRRQAEQAQRAAQPPQQEPMTASHDSLKPISAATRIFALQNHLDDQIGIASATEGHIGEHIEVNPAPDANCTFVMKKRDGPWVESINFKRLSSEYGVSRDMGYYSISLHGSGEAACYNDVQGKACEDHLSMLLTEDEMTLALRALRYIFSNVCAATELPF